MSKKHLAGGTLRAVMAAEILRVLEKYQDDSQLYEKAAIELGTTPRTLRVWRGPINKGGWEELQPRNCVERLMNTVKGRKSKTQ